MAKKSARQCAQVHPSVEAVCEVAGVLAGVLAEPEGLVAAADHGVEVAKEGIDPFELGHVGCHGSTAASTRTGARERRLPSTRPCA